MNMEIIFKELIKWNHQSIITSLGHIAVINNDVGKNESGLLHLSWD